MVVIDGFHYELSNKADKKLQVYVGHKWVHFGQKGYQHYFDKTKLLPKSWNHKDSLRRQQYLARSTRIRNGMGQLTASDPHSANYHAIRVLW